MLAGIGKLFGKKEKATTPASPSVTPTTERNPRSRSHALPQETKSNSVANLFSYHPKAEALRTLWHEVARSSSGDELGTALNRMLREYNPNYMEWMDQLQLAECGYYPTATNMESNIDKWLMPDSHFKYLTDSSFTYLGRSSDSSIPTITPELAAKLMEFLMSAIKAVRTKCDASTLGGKLLDVLYLLTILTKSQDNCELLIGDSNGIPFVDVARAVFQIFGELLSVTLDFVGDMAKLTMLVFFYCLVNLKNLGPVSTSCNSLQFMDARIIKVLSRLIVLLLNHIEPENELIVTAPPVVAPGPFTFARTSDVGRFGWRELSLFVMIQQVLAVALRKRPDIRPQLREIKLLEEAQLKFLGRPSSSLLPRTFDTFLSNNRGAAANNPLVTKKVDPLTPMALQISIAELLATAFLDVPSIQRWSAVGGFKALINATLWIAQSTDLDNDLATDTERGPTPPATRPDGAGSSPSTEGSSATSAFQNSRHSPLHATATAALPPVPKYAAPPVPGTTPLAPLPALAPLPTTTLAPLPDSSSQLPALPTLPPAAAARDSPIPLEQLKALPEPWDTSNPPLVRLFEAYFHMCLCTSDSEIFNSRVMSAICGIFDRNVLSTPANTAARDHMMVYPEAQLSFLCLLCSLYFRNPRCADEYLRLGIWDTLLNSGFFLLHRKTENAAPQDGEATAEGTTPPAVPPGSTPLSVQLHRELSRYFFKFIAHLASTIGRNNETEIMILLSILSSPSAQPEDIERAAITLGIIVSANLVPTGAALIYVSKHKAVLMAHKERRLKIDRPFVLFSPPTIDEKRRNKSNSTASGFGSFLALILDIDKASADHEKYTPKEIEALLSARSSLIIMVNRLLSHPDMKQLIHQQNDILSDIFWLFDDPNPAIFGLGIHWVADLLNSGTPEDRARESTFFLALGNLFLDQMKKKAHSPSLRFEIALLNGFSSVCSSEFPPPHDLQHILFQGHLKLIAFIERVVNNQSNWPNEVVMEFLVASIRALSSMLINNPITMDSFCTASGLTTLKTLIMTVASAQPLTHPLLLELCRLMFDGREGFIIGTLQLEAVPVASTTPNALLINTVPTQPRRRVIRRPSVITPVSAANLPGSSEQGEVPGAFITPNLLPSPASSKYEDDEVAILEAYVPPNPRIASLLFDLMMKFAPEQQVTILDIFLYLTTRGQSVNVTLSAFCSQGLLSKALALVPLSSEPLFSSRIFQLIAALGRHTINVRDIGRILSLFKPTQLDYRPSWSVPLLESLDSMIEVDDSPPSYFHFDGVEAALVLPTLSRFPLGRGFSMTAKIQVEDFNDPLQQPNYQPRLLSFLDPNGYGFEIIVYRTHLLILVHREERTEPLQLNFPKEAPLQPKTWYFIALTYSVSTQFLGKSSSWKLYIGDRFIEKVTSKKDLNFITLKYCYIGSSWMPDAPKRLNSVPSPPSQTSTTSKSRHNAANRTAHNESSDPAYYRSFNRSFYGYISEISFFDEELSPQVVAAIRNGESKENLPNNEWSDVFDPMTPSNSVSLTMSYSPRNTSAVVNTSVGAYQDPYRSDPAARFRLAPDADIARINANDPETAHICYDSSPAARDAIFHKGLHVVHRTQIHQMISCVSGGANALIPLFQLVDKSDQLTANQIVAKRQRSNQSTAAAPPLLHAQSTTFLPRSSHGHRPDTSLPGESRQWSMARVPKRTAPSSGTLQTSAPRLGPSSPPEQYMEFTSAKLLRYIAGMTMHILFSSTELQNQFLVFKGLEVISFLLVRSNPSNMSEEFLNLIVNSVTRNQYARHLKDAIIENLLLEAHLWIYTPPTLQHKLWTESLTHLFIVHGTGDYRARLNVVSRMLEIIRIYYWETGAAVNVMASEPVIDPQTGDFIAERPPVPRLRLLRSQIYNLILAIITKEVVDDEVRKKEYTTIVQFLKDCTDQILVIELLDFLESLYRRLTFYFEKFLEFLIQIGPASLLLLLENRPPEVRNKVLNLINCVIQSRYISQHATREPSVNSLQNILFTTPVPVVYTGPLSPPLVDFPIAGIFEHLLGQPIDQSLYDALISIVFLLPPFFKGKYLINPETGNPSIIRIWPALSGLARLLSGRNPALQTLFIDDFSFLVSGNDTNLENMLSGMPTWPLWFFAAAARGGAISPRITESPPSTISSDSPSLAPPDVSPLQKLHVKVTDTLKNIAARILTLKSGSSFMSEFYCWVRTYTMPDDKTVIPDAEYYEQLYVQLCREILPYCQRQFEITFADSFTDVVGTTTPEPQSRPSTAALPKAITTGLINAVSFIMSISEYVLHQWTFAATTINLGASLASLSESAPSIMIPLDSSVSLASSSAGVSSPSLQHPSPGSTSLGAPGSSTLNFGNEKDSDLFPYLGFDGKPYLDDLIEQLLRSFEKLEGLLENLQGFSVTSSTEITTYRAKAGFRVPGGCSLLLRLTCALMGSDSKLSTKARSFAWNFAEGVSRSARKVTVNELHFAIFNGLFLISQRVKDNTIGNDTSWSDLITKSFLEPLGSSSEVAAMLAASKNHDQAFTELLKSFVPNANFGELVSQPAFDAFMTRLKKKLQDLAKDEQSARKAARGYLVKTYDKQRLRASTEDWTERQHLRNVTEGINKTVDRYLSAVRVLDPKTIRENYAAMAYRWRDTLRMLRSEFSPWGSGKPIAHWKLSRVEAAGSRARPFFKANTHFNSHKDAAHSNKANRKTQLLNSSELQAPSSVKRLLAHNLKGLLKSNDPDSENTADLDEMATPDDDHLGPVRLDSRMALPTSADGSPNQAASSSNARVASRPTTRYTCLWIRPMRVIRGTMEINQLVMRFKPEEVVNLNLPGSKQGDKPAELPRERSWRVAEIMEVRSRRYLLQQNAIEVFFNDRTNSLFAFSNTKERKEVLNTFDRCCQSGTLVEARTPEQVFQRSSDVTKRWQHRLISNFDYLMWLNSIAGRTYNDLSQYPVFPWIISDMTSTKLDLTDPNTFRDLGKPIGALNPARLEQFRARYDSFAEEEDALKFLYGTHYSTAATVLFYMVRVEPFTSLAIELQDGSFDIADRMFNSLPQCFANCMTSTSDVKELIPEFYYLPEMLINTNNFDLGKLHSGEQAGDVQLPPWASTPDEFVSLMRKALESDYVSEHLHEWIDLIFGFKQYGPEAVNADNLFHYMSYEKMANLDALTDPMERQSAETAIREFGQTPAQVTRKPHPARYAPTIPECLLPEYHARRDESFLAGKGRLSFVAAILERSELLCIDAEGKIKAFETNLVVKETKLAAETNFNRQESLAYDEPVRISPPHLPQNPRTAVVSKDGKHLFSCLHEDNTIRVLSLDVYRVVDALKSHKDVVTCLAMSEDGTLLVSGSKDTTVRIWPASPGQWGSKAIRSLNDHDDEIVCVAVHAGLGIVASSSKDTTIMLHYLNSGEYIASIRHPRNLVFDLIAISSLGYIVAFSHADVTLYTFSMTGRLVVAEEAAELPKAMLITKDGEFIITGGRRNSTGCIVIRRLLSDGTKEPHRFWSSKPPIAPIWSLSYSSDENWLVAGLESGYILIKELPAKRLYIR